MLLSRLPSFQISGHEGTQNYFKRNWPAFEGFLFVKNWILHDMELLLFFYKLTQSKCLKIPEGLSFFHTIWPDLFREQFNELRYSGLNHFGIWTLHNWGTGIEKGIKKTSGWDEQWQPRILAAAACCVLSDICTTGDRERVRSQHRWVNESRWEGEGENGSSWLGGWEDREKGGPPCHPRLTWRHAPSHVPDAVMVCQSNTTCVNLTWARLLGIQE